MDAAELERRFGSRVREIVEHCTDGDPGADRGAASWLPRKIDYLIGLRRSDDNEALLVTVADKVSNANAILEDLRQASDVFDAELLWGRFKAGAQGTAWYYAEVSETASARMPDNTLVQRLGLAPDAIAEAAGGTDVVAELAVRHGLSSGELRRSLALLEAPNL